MSRDDRTAVQVTVLCAICSLLVRKRACEGNLLRGELNVVLLSSRKLDSEVYFSNLVHVSTARCQWQRDMHTVTYRERKEMV